VDFWGGRRQLTFCIAIRIKIRSINNKTTPLDKQRGSGKIIIYHQPVIMRCSCFLWSSIFHSLVAVEAFAALSHRSFASAPASARSLMVATTIPRGGGVARTTGGASALRSSTSSTTALELSGGDGAATATPEGTATIPNEVFNLVKSIVGAGVLSVSNHTTR
jgi:hypothetical protein